MTGPCFFAVAIFAFLIPFSFQSTCNSKNPLNVGTTLFSESDLLKECWSSERITLLTYRMVLEDILPSPDVLKVRGEEFVIDIVDYFKLVLEVVRRIADINNKHLMLLALADLLGGYLNHVVLPIAKYAYYGGTLNYENTLKLYQLFDELKCFLRTNGEGWEKSMNITSQLLDIKPLPAETPGGANPCQGLIYYERTPDEVKKHPGEEKSTKCTVEIPMPFLDSKSKPGAIAVPFKTFSLRNLESRASTYVLVKFYIASHKCLAHKKARPEDVSTFENKLFTWINRFVINRLRDEKLYAAFGGVLRVYMSLKQRAGRGGSKEIGNYNVMPEVEEKEPINDIEGGLSEKQESNTTKLILYIALAVIFIWFLLGTLFICYKIRANRMQKRGDSGGRSSSHSRKDTPRSGKSTRSICEECCSPTRSDTKGSGSWPQVKQKSSNKSLSSDKKVKSTGDIPASPRKGSNGSVKSTPSKSRSVTNKASSSRTTYMAHTEIVEENDDDNELSEGTQTSDVDRSQSVQAMDQAAEANFPDEDDDDDADQPPVLPVDSAKQVYYAPAFACHSGMTGRVGVGASSSTEDASAPSQRQQASRPFVFGYDFQTSSSETTPRGPASDSEEMKGNMSR